MSTIRKRLKRAVCGQRNVVGGSNGLGVRGGHQIEEFDTDAVRIAVAMRMSKFAERTYYGPGADAANARRAERLAPSTEPPVNVDPVPPEFEMVSARRRDQNRRERLMKKIDDIRKRLDALK